MDYNIDQSSQRHQTEEDNVVPQDINPIPNSVVAPVIPMQRRQEAQIEAKEAEPEPTPAPVASPKKKKQSSSITNVSQEEHPFIKVREEAQCQSTGYYVPDDIEQSLAVRSKHSSKEFSDEGTETVSESCNLGIRTSSNAAIQLFHQLKTRKHLAV